MYNNIDRSVNNILIMPYYNLISNIIKNDSEWLLVLYKIGLKFKIKIFKSNEVIEAQRLFEKNDERCGSCVWIRDNEQVILGNVLYKAISEQGAVNKNVLIQCLSRKLSYSLREFSPIAERFNNNFWLLVMYTPEMATSNERQSIFEVFHRSDVVLKKDYQNNNIVAFVQVNHSTYKGIVMKISNNLADLMYMIRRITIKETKAIEKSEVVLNMSKSPTADKLDIASLRERLKLARTRHFAMSSIFNRLEVLLSQINGSDEPQFLLEEIRQTDATFITDHNYDRSSTSSGVSSNSYSSPSASPPLDEQDHRSKRCSTQYKTIEVEKYHEFSTEDEHIQLQQDYPNQIGDNIILGPNGTEVDKRSYDSVVWSSAAAATRQLLGFVFSSDVLATHTLTGKPSPAFYGRERPPKMQLDPLKAADIIQCVRSKFNCSEREIRAAITTKCSDTSKKYKRRYQRQAQSLNTTDN